MDAANPAPLAAGDKVRVVSGTFAFLEGTVLGADEIRNLELPDWSSTLRQQSTWVMLSMKGQQAPVCILTSLLQKI